MNISPEDFNLIYREIYSAYPNIDDFEIVLQLGAGKDISDYAAPGNSRRQAIFKSVTAAVKQGWVLELLRAVMNDETLAQRRAALEAAWAPVLERLEPEPGFEHHDHLQTDGVAFVNRASLRDSIRHMIAIEGPRVLVLRGDPLTGTSYAWRLINHVARGLPETGRAIIDFEDDAGDPSPLGVMLRLRNELGIADDPVRSDMPSDDHLAGYLVSWLTGRLNASNKKWWLVFDNAHLEIVPELTKEMLLAFARSLARGTVDNVRMFVLGFSMPLSGAGAPYARDMRLMPLGRTDILDFLRSVEARFGNIGDFPSPEEAVDDVLTDLDLSAPTLATLSSVSEQLSHIVVRAKEGNQ